MSKTETVRALNKLARAMMGPPMTREQLEELEQLRSQVKTGKITVTEAHEIWNEKYGGW